MTHSARITLLGRGLVCLAAFAVLVLGAPVTPAYGDLLETPSYYPYTETKTITAIDPWATVLSDIQSGDSLGILIMYDTTLADVQRLESFDAPQWLVHSIAAYNETVSCDTLSEVIFASHQLREKVKQSLAYKNEQKTYSLRRFLSPPEVSLEYAYEHFARFEYCKSRMVHLAWDRPTHDRDLEISGGITHRRTPNSLWHAFQSAGLACMPRSFPLLIIDAGGYSVLLIRTDAAASLVKGSANDRSEDSDPSDETNSLSPGSAICDSDGQVVGVVSDHGLSVLRASVILNALSQ